jgi:hypothetical protein
MVYDMLLPAIPIILGYLGSYSFYKAGFIKKSFHINLWNLIIGLTFLISGGAGFILMILLETGLKLPLSIQMLYWHVEVGVTLVLVTVFHFHTYWKTSRTMFALKKRKQVI